MFVAYAAARFVVVVLVGAITGVLTGAGLDRLKGSFSKDKALV